MGILDVPALSQITAKATYASKFRATHERRPSQLFVAAAAADTPALSQLTTTTGISGSRPWPSVTSTTGSTTGFTLTSEFFSYNCAGSPTRHGSSSPDTNYIRFTSLTNATAGSQSAPYAVDFDHSGSQLEMRFKQLSGQWKLTVNGAPAFLSTIIIVLGGPTGGTFTITIGGQTTSGLAYNASTSTVQTALAALSSVGAGNVVVTGNAGSYLITLVSTAQGQAITTATALTGGTSPSLEVAASPVVGVNSTGGVGVQLLTFPTAEHRRIRWEASGLPFGGVNTAAIDTITPAQMGTPRPRVICVGDSYTEGANNPEGPLTHWVRWFAEIMGWDDVWSSGAGGTGWMNPSGIGGRVKFRDRLAADVIAYSPDLVIYMGGHNDLSGYTSAAVAAEVLASLQQVSAALPNCMQVVIGPLLSNGMDTGIYGVTPAYRDAMKTATASGGSLAFFLDPIEMPLARTPVVTTMNSTAGVNSTSASLVAPVSVGSTLDFGTERRRVTAQSGVGPYAATLHKGLTQQHTSGATVTEVGPGFITGSGSVAAPVGDGNADIITGTDAVHPTRRGQKMIGNWVASAVSRLALPTA